MIGEGSFGTVRLGYKTNNPQKKYAIKSILRVNIEKSRTNLIDLEHELNILISVDHPYICRFYEVYLDHMYVHLVMEYCEGGDVYEKLKAKVTFKEDEAKKIVKQCLLALQHLHLNKIVHRDIKLENVLVQG